MSNLPDSIGQPAWMTLPATVAVIEALEAKGFAGCARFVGGCVRNTLLKTEIDDVDIATTLTPDQVTEALEQAGLKVVPTGVDHGTVTGISQGRPYEITTLRKDVSTDGRRAVVSFTKSWSEDAERRDFRLNALYADADGRLFDPTGEGIADCLAGRIVFVGDPMTRISEDYLRILRWFRFHAWYGKGDVDAQGLRAAADAKDKLKTLSAERIAKELLRLLEAGNPTPVLRVMAATGILSELLPGALQLPRLERLVEIDADELAPRDGLLRLAALLPEGGDAAHAVADALKLSNADRLRLEQALSGERIAPQLSAPDARRLLYRVGVSRFRDKVRLAWAGAARSANAIQWRMLLAMADNWQRPRFPLSGLDVMQAGVPEGPEIGRVLALVEDWWIGGDFASDEGALRDRLRAVIHGA